MIRMIKKIEVSLKLKLAWIPEIVRYVFFILCNGDTCLPKLFVWNVITVQWQYSTTKIYPFVPDLSDAKKNVTMWFCVVYHLLPYHLIEYFLVFWCMVGMFWCIYNDLGTTPAMRINKMFVPRVTCAPICAKQQKGLFVFTRDKLKWCNNKLKYTNNMLKKATTIWSDWKGVW